MSKHRPFAHVLLTLTFFMFMATLFVLSQVFFEWSCPLWVSFAIGSVVFLPLSEFISFRIMLVKEDHLRMRRSGDYRVQN